MQWMLTNWEWVLLAFYVIEKVVKLSPTKKDDVIFDMVLKPLFDAVKGKGGK
jgi:hypothetical protein|tara:strand:- start:514 stop:669 length:156 start_codon:yes stop_codon:yes gene_type:complete